MSAPALRTFRPVSLVFAALLFGVAGCAQQQAPGYYAVERESTLADAQSKARGPDARAPSQIQLGFGDNVQPGQNVAQTDNGERSAQTSAITPIRPLREAKTFLGTLPCPSASPDCAASRITLTLAPDGQWRSRSVDLQKDAGAPSRKPATEQGCWDQIGAEPWRISLRTADKAIRATLTFTNDNVLRVDSYNNIRPALDYHLTRQQDIDGISELDGAPALNCRQRNPDL